MIITTMREAATATAGDYKINAPVDTRRKNYAAIFGFVVWFFGDNNQSKAEYQIPF